MRLPFAALLLSLPALACLRAAPTLGGKLCTPTSSECGADLSCVTALDGASLGLDGGLCALRPTGCEGFTCPQDAGVWVCAQKTCFAPTDPELAGSTCTHALGRCRQEGIFQWNEDGGLCVVAPDGPSPQGECHLDAGGRLGLLCPCDGIDDDCNGVPDDFPHRPTTSFVLSSTAVGTACDGGPGALILAPGTATALAGVQVSACAEIDLQARYAFDSLVIRPDLTVTAACGTAAHGGATPLEVFGADHEGATPLHLGKIPAGVTAFSLDGGYSDLLVCLPGSATTAIRLPQVQLLRGSSCDPR